MSKPKDIRFSNNAVDAMIRGIDTFTDVIALTLGPRGRNVIYTRTGSDEPSVTKDGVTVAKEVELEERYANMGCSLIREASAKTSDESGDGTTTVAILSRAMIKEGWKLVQAGHDPLDIKKGIDFAANMVIEHLKENCHRVKSYKEIAQVATLSSNGDEHVGKMIAEAMDMIGINGVVIVEDSPTAETSLKVIEGTKIDAGYASPDFVPEGDFKTTLENAYVFVSLEPISALKGMVDLLDKVVKTEKPLFILAESITGEALKTIIINHKRGNLFSCVVRGPGVGDKKREAMQDIAILTGATPFSFDLGKDLGHFALEDLGQAKKITVTNKDTLIIGGAGDIHKVEERINQIKLEMNKTWSEFDKERYQDRLGRLAGGIAIIYVGAHTESELSERKARVEDALNATQAAAGIGISPGGGVALLRASEYLKGRLEEVREEYLAGFKIMIKALQAPIGTLLSNGYIEPPSIIQNIIGDDTTRYGYDYGYNIQTNQYQNLYETGVVDPTKVVISTIQNSSSIAGITLTTAAGVAKLI